MAAGELMTLLRRVVATERAGLSDAQLLEQFRARRDESAFAALVRRHGPLVMTACRQVLSEPADVEDAFQATFLVLLRRMSSIRDGAALAGWWYRVAGRVALRARKAAARRRTSPLPDCAGPAPDLSWREACAILHAELDRLPEKFRLPLLVCYLEGLSRDRTARRFLRSRPGRTAVSAWSASAANAGPNCALKGPASLPCWT